MGKKIQYIGRYVMDAITLGKGNFARVELATHGVTQIKVAIKVIDTRKIKEDYVRQNLHREARIMAQLRHPNIIRLYETLKKSQTRILNSEIGSLITYLTIQNHFISKSQTRILNSEIGSLITYLTIQNHFISATTLYCLVTEFAAGGELLTYIKSQESSRLTEAQARNYIRQLISAIYYLHERSVVHRDLKMENIMLDESKNNIKLIDFGLSNVYREDDPLKTHCGSPEYAAPELFIVGRTYGPEIDIWSLGIITYAMVLGKLPFFAPFKDEYMKQRLLQSIQKGLSSYHDREMHAGGLSQECRHMLHQIIEPNPEARIQMSEVIIHPWVTRNGKYPFCPYVNPPKDTNMRRQVVGELAFMMNLKRRNVEDTVKETRADELSSMFNMMMDQKRRTGGLFDIDHTFRKCARRDRDSRSRSRERDKVKTPDSGRAKLVNPKGGQKKVPNKCKAGVNGKAKPKNKHYASGTRPPDKTTLQFSATDTLIGEHTRVVIHHEPGVRKPVEVCHTPRRPKTSYLGVPAVIVGGEDKPHPSTANGPTKIPLSQRRVPPAKLNLTLDLSVTNRLPSSKPPISVSGNAGATETGGGRQGPSVGIAASSGVPPRLSTPNKSLPSKIPVLSPTSKEKSTASAQTPKASNRPSNLCAGLKSRTETGCCSAEGASRLCQTKENMIAPKATPEDSAIDSYSTSSEEPSPVEAISTGVVPGTSQAQCEATMQHEMLKASADEKGRQARLQCQTSCTNSSSGDVSSNNPTETHTEDTSSSCTLEKKPLDVRCKTSRHKLVKNLSESEQYTGTASASPTSRSTPSGYQLALLTASGSSLPTRIHDNCFTCADSVELPMSSSCLVTGTGSERRFSATGKTVSESRITAVSAGVQQSNVNPAFKLFLSNPAKLNTPKDCGMCGLSPGSPSYDQKHSKFCHTGAHALDVFVSPDEVPSSSDALWRPTVSTYRGSPLPHSSPVFQFPRVAHTPGFPMQSSGALVDTFTDSEFEDDEEHATKSGTAFTYSTPVQCHELCHIHRRRPLLGSTGRSLSDNTESRQVRLAHQNRTSLLNSELHTRPHDTTLNFESGEGCPEIKQLEPLETTTEPVGGVLQHQQDDSRLDQSDAPCDKVNQQPEQEVSPPCKSRIPRPATKSGKMHVFRLLSSEKKDKEDIIGDERQPKRSHSLPKKSERNKFLKHSDGRSRQLSWRRGLSQLLRMTRPSPNSNNNISVIKTKQSNGTTRNSVTPGNKAGARPTDNTIKEKDPKWNTKHPLTHKCNSPEVTSSPVPSSPPPNVPDQYDVNTGSDQHADVSESSHKSKSKKVSLSGCKECAKSDQSSDEEKEDRTEELELSMSGAMKATLVPAANSLKPLSKMTSKV